MPRTRRPLPVLLLEMPVFGAQRVVSPLLLGLIALLLRVYSGRRPYEILVTPPDFFDAIELGSHLSGRSPPTWPTITTIPAWTSGSSGPARASPAPMASTPAIVIANTFHFPKTGTIIKNNSKMVKYEFF